MSLISQDYMERYQGELDTAIKDYVSRHSAVNLSEQKDVAVNNPTNGQVLKWNASLGKWVNANESGGGGVSVNSLGDIGDIALGTLKDGQIIKWDDDAQVWVNADNESGGKTYIGTCTTAAATAAKEATVDSDFQLVKGTRIGIKFTNSNTASNCTLNVNSTGAKSIYYNSAVYTGADTKICGYANRYHYFLYDGTYWLWDGISVELDTTYSSKAAVSGGTDVSLVTTGEKYAWNNKGSGTVTSVKVGSTSYSPTDGVVSLPAYPTDTNNAVAQTATTTNANYEVLFSNTADNTTRTEGARKNTNLTFNPSTGNLQATQLNGATIGSSPKFTDTTYTPQSLGFGFGTCTTAAATVEKAVTLANYNLVTNGYVSVKFTNAVPASATMNINTKGAKAIYYKGAAITANIIGAGDLATFIYNGSQYHLVGIDKAVEGGTTSYPDLSNKPSINSVTLSGNKTLNDLGIMPKPTYLTQTLTAGNTSITFTNSAIASNSYVSVYTNVAGLNYTSLTVGTGTITITFPAQSANITVALEIKNV